jgi:Sec-independent protein secretion pathway component TatC
MSVGISEVVLLCVVSVAAFSMCVVGRNWFFLGMVPLFLIAMLVTPADPLSCLVVGLPTVLIYAFTVRRLNSSDSTADR